MYELLQAVADKMDANGVPYSAMGVDPAYIYYPTRIGYQIRVRLYDGDTEASVYATGGDYICSSADADEIYDIIANRHFHAKKAVDFVTEEIGRLKAFDAGCKALSTVARNLNLLALEGKIFRAYGRDEEAADILRIMLRKTKSNALLVGSAGCGKTAIVENLAYYITDARMAYLRSLEDAAKAKRLGEEADEVLAPLFNDTVIYDLDLSSLVAGTKYRGDFEEKVKSILHELEKNPNIIVFIDEIHMLNSAGQSEGGSNGLGQLLKPALARGTIKCIGATTDEEVGIVYEDRALARRFNKVKVLPLGGNKAITVCGKILADYSAAHGIKVDGITAEELYAVASTKLKETSFPDNVINLIDETLASAKFARKSVVDKTDFNATLARLLGSEIVSVKLGFQF
jgi:ATP-dependent Clp protease ATP-binding subunit ClpA